MAAGCDGAADSLRQPPFFARRGQRASLRILQRRCGTIEDGYSTPLPSFFKWQRERYLDEVGPGLAFGPFTPTQLGSVLQCHLQPCNGPLELPVGRFAIHNQIGFPFRVLFLK